MLAAPVGEYKAVGLVARPEHALVAPAGLETPVRVAPVARLVEFHMVYRVSKGVFVLLIGYPA